MNNPNINWHRIYAITALNSAIIICWMAYHFFQPKLLAQFGLQSASDMLTFSQAIVLVVIPPISGFLADRFAGKTGSNYLIFTIGISFTALIFFAAAYSFLDAAPAGFKAAIPFMMVLWLIGMNIFYAPSTGFILNSARPAELPLAIAFITVATNLLFAVLDYLMWFLEYCGSSFTFIVGGLLLLLAAVYYFRVAKSTEPVEIPEEEFKNNFLLVFWVGLLCGVLEILGIIYLPQAIDPLFGGFDISTIIFIIAAILAFPLCYRLMKYPMMQSFYLSWLACMAVILLAYFLPNLYTAILAIAVLSVASAAVGIMSFPYALSRVRAGHQNLGAGIFLGSFSLGMTLVGLCMQFLDKG